MTRSNHNLNYLSMPTNGQFQDEPQAPGGYGGSGDWIGAIIGASAGLYDSHQNRKASKENTDKTIAAQKAEAELAYQRSMAAWNAQNMYNTPEAQMNRFKAAGLNPHLIYGQGSSGLASSPPQYQPANLQYKYEAAQYGAPIASILPTLMAVGTWMQNMRLSEADLRKTAVDTERGETDIAKATQLMDFLRERNPQLISQGRHMMSLQPYQKSFQRDMANKAYLNVADLEQDYRYKYGDALFRELRHDPNFPSQSNVGGIRRLQYLQEQSKTKLLDAKSSWSDFNITDPQAIMQLVLSGVMGLAGQTLRLSTHRRQTVREKPKQRTEPFNWSKFKHD